MKKTLFACAFLGLMRVFTPARRLPIAVVAVLAASAAGAAWWLVDGRGITLLTSLTLGGLIGLVAFLQDSGSIEPPGVAVKTRRGADAR